MALPFTQYTLCPGPSQPYPAQDPCCHVGEWMEYRGQRARPKWYQDMTGTSPGHRRCSAQLQQSSNAAVPQQPPKA